MFACVLYVCLCVVCLLCGDWVCTQFRTYEMRRLDLCSPNPTLYYSIGSYSVKILHYAVIVCLLCIVCLLVCCIYVCYAVIGSVLEFRNYEIAAIGFVLSKPDAVLFDWVLLCTNLTLCGDCMFACVLYVCLCVVCFYMCIAMR